MNFVMISGNAWSLLSLEVAKAGVVLAATTAVFLTAFFGWPVQGHAGETCERFRRAAYDGQVISTPSLLLRSAFADAVCLRDPANNLKLAKARSTGRIDAVAASVLAVAEGVRRTARPQNQGRAAWA